MSAKPKVLITGASSGIGAVYADRFARRGHDLVLVARDRDRLETLAAQLRRDAGIAVEVVRADLTDAADLAALETKLRDDATVEILVNNAGAAVGGGFVNHTGEAAAKLIDLNITAVARLAIAVAPRLAAAGRGAIVNVGSVVGLAPEMGMTLYGATKAFVLYLSQGLQGELGPKGVYVQAVLPAATRTEIWARSGMELPAAVAMDAGELVDAALLGFNRREPVTIPPLPQEAQWQAFEAARTAMLPNFRQVHAAERYRV